MSLCITLENATTTDFVTTCLLNLYFWSLAAENRCKRLKTTAWPNKKWFLKESIACLSMLTVDVEDVWLSFRYRETKSACESLIRWFGHEHSHIKVLKATTANRAWIRTPNRSVRAPSSQPRGSASCSSDMFVTSFTPRTIGPSRNRFILRPAKKTRQNKSVTCVCLFVFKQVTR